MKPATRVTRQRILAAAIAIFTRDGVSGLTMRAIAKEVGISAAAIYGHYESRNAILADIWRIGCVDLARSIAEPIASEDGTERICTLTHRYIEWALAQPELFDLVYREKGAATDEPEPDCVSNVITILSGEIERGIAQGQFQWSDVKRAAITILAQSRGLISLHRAGLLDMPRDELPMLARHSAGYVLRELTA